METAFGQSAKVLRPGRPRIDWSHPLTRALKICYVPGLAGGVDIAARAGSLDLTISSACSFDVGPDGPALKVNASTSPNYAAHYESVPSTHPLRNWSECSFFARLAKTPGQTLPTDGPCIWAIEHNNAVSNPYVSAGLGIYDASNVGLYWNSGGTFNFDVTNLGKSIAGAAADVPFNIIGTFKVGGNAQIFVDIGGTISTGSSSFGASAPTYNSTATLDLGGLTGQDTAPFKYEIAAWFDSELTAEEKYYLSQNPFCFIVWDEEDSAQAVIAGGSTYNESIGESAAAVDAESATGILGATQGETASATDSESGSLGGLNLDESAAAVDSEAATGVLVGSDAESASAADAQAGTGVLAASLAESASASDAPSTGARISIGLGRIIQILWDANPVVDAATWDTDLTISSFNTSTDAATATGHSFATGTIPGPFLLDCPNGFPGGLSGSTKYWLIIVDANTIKFATSPANANAGTAVNITSAGTSPFTLLRKIDTTPGSALITAIARGVWANDGSAATDNKGNNYGDFDATHAYAGYPASSVRMRVDLSATTGAGHIVQATVTDKNPPNEESDEATAVIVEAKGASRLVDDAWVERAAGSASITTPAVTTDGESLVVVFLWGNNGGGQHAWTPVDAGWEKLEEATGEGHLGVGYIQLSVFSKHFDSAQTNLTAEFQGTSNEGAQIFVFAFAPPDTLAESASAAETQAATGALGASATEAASAADAEAATGSLQASAAEAATAADAESGAIVGSADDSETASATESESSQLDGAATGAEAAPASEAESAQASLTAGLDESASAADSQSAAGVFDATLGEAATADSAQDGSSPGIDVSLDEAASASDTEGGTLAAEASRDEAEAAADAQYGAAAMEGALGEAAAASDAPDAASVKSASIGEAAVAADTQDSTIGDNERSLDEAAPASEAESAQAALGADANESADATDAPSSTIIAGAAAAEVASAADSSQFTYVPIIKPAPVTRFAGSLRGTVKLNGSARGTVNLRGSL